MRFTPWSLSTHRSLVTLALLALFVCPIHLRAQDAVREPVSHNNLISGGPLMLLAGWFNAEYEVKLSENFTVGAAGGWLDRADTDYTGVNAFLRYYHQGAAFTGFYVGPRGGIYNVERGDDSETTLGIGLDVGYGWLLGPADAFFIGLGIGVTALTGVDLDGAKSVIPNVRLLDVGIAF